MMKTLLLKKVVLNGKISDILIEGNRFKTISASGERSFDADEIYDAQGRLAVLPPFYNAHNHAAMTLLRGYADDCELFDWLSNHIWPLEEQLTPDDIYAGTRLACLEMIRSGTVFFNDMYWHQAATIRAVDEFGMRAAVGIVLLNGEVGRRTDNAALLAGEVPHSERIQIALAPHAIYTVTDDGFKKCKELVEKTGFMIHTHLAETQKECDDCQAAHGMTPAAYLDSFGLLGEHTVLAHCVGFTDADFELAAKRRAVLCTCPVSNLKLASGRFRWSAAHRAGCRIALGTDGASSNNNLSMLDEVKTAALIAKELSGDPKALNAREAYALASKNGADAFGIDSGVIAEGKLADCLLVNLDAPALTPGYHLESDMVYAADPSCMDSVICDGKFLMRHGIVPGEAEIVAEARKTAFDLVARLKRT